MGMYKKEQLVQITYERFGKNMDVLTQKITDYQTENNMKFNMVVPLLRSGAFPAFHIAARLEIKNIIPVYYMYQNGKLIDRIEIPKITYALPEELNVLICDACLTSGTTLKSALADVKSLYPTAKFYAAITWLEIGHDSIPGIEKVFSGAYTSEKEPIVGDVINGLVVAPWEDLEVDWNEIKGY